ncbi:hypothetical protein TNIN_251 [Trichonephila inaurata madagascariensis]|uniref:Uncharacterized protein n=1 Tax=Trichonephila inaurata madagascariensis TaxID=2747483 RepID=A0A8X6YW65_9ARAC|nr:hypothetical protein TNIN_251 [Trichonephila inaurata madagascariensis]
MSEIYKCKRSIRSKESSIGLYNKTKKSRHEVSGCKRRNPSSRSEGPQRKRNRGPERQLNKRGLPSSSNPKCPLNKKLRQSEVSLHQRETGLYHLRPRNKITKEAGSRTLRVEMQTQGGPFRSRGERFQKPSPYRQESKQQGHQKP